MKGKLKILGCALILNCFQLLAQDSTSVVNMWIERGYDKSAWRVHLIIENPSTVDTVLTRSTFFIDEYFAINRIFIYRCRAVDSMDSIACDWGYSRGVGERNSVSLSDEITVKIPPKSQIVLDVPIFHYYIGHEIFLEIRMAYSTGRPEDASFLTKRTNKILFEREPTEHEEFQRRRSIERANERRNRQNEEQEND